MVDRSEPRQRERWRSLLLHFLAIFAIVIVAAAVRVAVFGPKDRKFQPPQPDYKSVETPTARR